MAVVLNETFVGAAGNISGRAAATGGTPTQYSGTYSTSTIAITSNGHAKNPTATNEAAAYYYGSATPANADYVVEAQITMSPAQIASGQAFGVLGRCVIGTATWYGLMVYLDQLYMTVVVAGTTTFLTPVALTINDGDIWFIRLTMTGTTISGNARLSSGSYGAELISVTNSTISAKGVPGVMLNSINGDLNLLTATDSASSGTAITITGSASIAPNVATTYTFTPAASITSVVTLSDGRTAGAGVFNPPTLTWSASAAAQTATYTAAGPNNVSLTGTGSGSSVTPKAVTVAWTVTKQVAFLGDALTYGTGATPGTSDYATVALSKLDGSWTGTNFGVVGEKAQTVAASGATLASQAASRMHATRDNYVVAQWGKDDLRTGRTNAQLIADLKTIATAYRAANGTGRFRFIAQTIQPGYSTGVGILGSYDLLVQQSWNAYLRANYASNGIDLVSDLASNPLVGQAGAETSGTYFDADKVHMTAAGYALVASIAASALAEATYLPLSSGTAGPKRSTTFDGGYPQ